MVPRFEHSYILILAATAAQLGCGGDGGGNDNDIDNGNGSHVCGNGVLEPGEQCDDGADNSDVAPDACRTDCRAAYCGDGVIDSEEGCDGSELGGQTCETLGQGQGQGEGYTGGILACGPQCQLDEARCATCGNGTREPTEECDGADVGTVTCAELTGLQQGVVTCTESCEYDPSACHSCGNGSIEGSETCEGTDLGGVSCEVLGYAYGALRCGSDCQFDEGQCHSICGNGVKEPGEACDGADFAGASCVGLGMVGGQLRCTSWCDISMVDCTSCGDGVKDPIEECDGADFGGQTCATLGGAGATGSLSCSGSCRIETAGCTADASCGNGIIDPGLGEQCDGNDLGGHDCASAFPALYGGGTLGCSSACLFDTGSCTPLVTCENGQAEPSLGEQCDGQNLDGQTCQGLGYPGGVLACGADCGYDTSGCDALLTCGNGTRETGEACDQQDLGGATCQTIGFVGGTLSCRADCSYDTSACQTCGDGVVNGDDECDGNALAGESCQTLGYYGGALSCDAGCAFDLTSCEAAGYCGDGVLQAGEGEQCDGQEFGNDDCASRGFDGGVLACTATCQVSTSSCSSCGNGICEVGEPATCSPDCFRQPIAAGDSHTCAIKPDGSLWCWGNNNRGQLGDGTPASHFQPIQVVGLGGNGMLEHITRISAGGDRTCALRDDRTVLCWGTDSPYQGSYPSQVVGPSGSGILDTVVDVSTGGSSSCAVRSDGSALCWGDNDFGQLGDGSNNDSAYPVQVLDPSGTGYLTGVVSVSVGLAHACAVTSTGSLFCWGKGDRGRLGNGGTADSNLPLEVTSLTGVEQVSTGDDHTCAVKTDGTLWCWGYGHRGTLGNGVSADSHVPVQVASLSTVESVQAGSRGNCALELNGELWCWGVRWVGDGTWEDRTLPVHVLSNVVHYATGSQHKCALLGDGSARCWGSNSYGQLGMGTSWNVPIPIPVQGGLTAHAITAGWNYTCAWEPTVGAWCWGANLEGQLGDGTNTWRRQPAPVVGTGGAGTLLSGVAQMTAGYDHTCAMLTNGTAWCWGRSNLGQLGDGTNTHSDTPVQVVDAAGTGTLANVQAIATGYRHTCAALSDGSAWCWGYNHYGQLGDGNTSRRYTPTQVVGSGGSGYLSSVLDISGGYYHTCAALTDGSAWCWGRNSEGQLGDGTSTDSLTPVQVLGPGGAGTLTDVVDIAAATREERTCAQQSNGSVWCWGYRYLGNGTSADSHTPVQVSITQASSPTIGVNHGCVMVPGSSSVACWGSNNAGQLGDGQLWLDAESPVAVSSLSSVSDLAAGSQHTCAALNDGTLWCWGSNNSGQLGNADWWNQPSPVTVIGF